MAKKDHPTPRPHVLFRNYDYTEDSDTTNGPGGGLYHGPMDRYKSVTDFLNKSRKRRARRRKAAWLVLAGDVLDFKKKLQEKQEEQEKKDELEEIKDNLSQISDLTPEISQLTELEQARERKQLQDWQSESGVWSHRFSKVKKDQNGFFILQQDNPAGKQMRAGDLLADEALNHTPYWKISTIQGDRINLEPIAPNPFVTGKGAGGAKILPQDLEVLTGEYEQKKVESIQEKMQQGQATIDDIKYILLGTVPVNFGPNGPQGGWYNVNDTRSNRARLKGLSKPEEIMQADAKLLQQYSFPTPRAALDGTMDPSDWNDWVEGGGGGYKERFYYPQNIDKYLEFLKAMTEKGKWRYDEETLVKKRQELDPQALEAKWEQVIDDFTHLSKKEFELKYKYLPYNLSELIQAYDRAHQELTKFKNKSKTFLTEEEEDSVESVLKNIFHPERRVAIRNIINLIGLTQEDPSYHKYLLDFVNLGGSDYFANEKVIEFFDLIDDVEGLKLAAKKFTDPENSKKVLHALLRQGEQDFVLKFFQHQPNLLDFYSLSEMLYSLGQRTKDKFGRSQYVIDWVKQHNLVDKIAQVVANQQVPESYFADDLINNILTRMGPTMNWQPGDEELVTQLKALSKKTV